MAEPADAPRPAADRTRQQGRRSTPTVQQGGSDEAPGGPGAAGRTRRQGRPDATRRQEPGESSANTGDPVFPDALRDRYTPEELRGYGTEGAVWRCTTGAGQRVAVKVNFAGRPMDAELLDHLSRPAFRRHVPEIHDHGRLMTPHGEVFWAAMEYLDRTLEDVVGAGLDAARGQEVLAEVARCLAFWQGEIERNPLDFKPDNLMVRAESPPRVVLADFGGVAAFTASQQVGGTFMAALAYTPPEGVWQEKRSPWPWWSLGEIAYLIRTGHTRFQSPDGTRYPDEVVLRIRHVGVLELGGIAEPRWQLLLRGLLTRDPADRWTHGEITEWLAGGSPAVIGPEAAPGATEPKHGPITFAHGRTFRDPAELAVQLLDAPDLAEEWLCGEGRQALLDWLGREKLTSRFDITLLRGLSKGLPGVHRAVLAFGASFAPSAVPRWRGHPVDAGGLLQLLGDGDGAAIARELADSRAFGTAAEYRCGHDSCAGRCAVLDEVAVELPRTVAAAEAVIRETRAPDAPISLGDPERARLHDLALLVLLEPSLAARQVRAGAATVLFGPRWWRSFALRVARADPSTPAGRALVTAAGVLERRAHEDTSGAIGEQRDAVRRRLSRSGRSLGIALLSFFGMLPALWVAAMLAHAEQAFGDNPALAAAAMNGATAVQLGLAPAVLVLASLTVLLGRPRRFWTLCGWGLAVLCGFFGDTLPPFTIVEVPGPVDDLLTEVAGLWTGKPWPGVLVSLLVAGVFLLVVQRLSAGPAGWTDGYPSTRAVSPPRRAAVYGLVVVALLAGLWAAGALASAVTGRGRFSIGDGGPYFAVVQSSFVLPVLVAAAIVAMGWPRTHRLLLACFAGVVVIGVWGTEIPPLEAIRYPVLTGPLVRLGAFWGSGAFWAALLVYLPVIGLCYRTVRRLGRP
ncbi:protein kinase domain-containing protein [Amycolatopsis sp. NBC_01286]|uniref:protein kinase domain-containing protein n=1 Tax=Amycolatopsis sp. NBC_01286 TaxID=2903560 RepID=UPI002E1280E5|nr:hypothetical protein OG570_36740 [Amycolatopsis sp. NBC_01286]